jgi:hypothetical protein
LKLERRRRLTVESSVGRGAKQDKHGGRRHSGETPDEEPPYRLSEPGNALRDFITIPFLKKILYNEALKHSKTTFSVS